MLDYLQKFNNLPEDVREKISSAQVMARISELEAKYNISLAAVVMKVMVDDVKIVDLAKYFVFEYGMDGRVASELVTEMKERVFLDVADFLGIITETDRANEAEADLRLQKERLGVRSSGFFFSPEDEEEVQKLAQNVDADPAMSGKAAPTVDEKVEFVMIESNVSFGSDELNNRFRQVVKTFIKGIRNRIDAKQALMKPVSDGGLGMNINSVEKIVFIAEQCKRELSGMPIAPIPRMKLPEDIIRLTGPAEQAELPKQTAPVASAGRDVSYDFSALATAAKKEAEPARPKHTFRVGVERLVASTKAPKEEIDPWSSRPETQTVAQRPIENISELGGAAAIIEKSEPTVQAAAVTPGQIPPDPEAGPIQNEAGAPPELIEMKKATVVQDISEVPVLDLKKAEEAKKPVEPIRSAEEAPTAPIRIISPVAEGKKKMDDIKYVPKLVGPIDELREMNLTNFRRVAGNAVEATSKFKKRIDLFEEEEGYGKKLEAIKAWRQSPINNLYLAMGQEAIIQKNGIGGAIETRQKEGREFLTEEEFDAIMEFNKSIRF